MRKALESLALSTHALTSGHRALLLQELEDAPYSGVGLRLHEIDAALAAFASGLTCPNPRPVLLPGFAV
jgi:hypothetical protein